MPAANDENLTGQPQTKTSIESNPSGARIDGVAIMTRLRMHLASILQMPEAEIDEHAKLPELGVDSIMALELSTEVQRDFGVELPLSPPRHADPCERRSRHRRRARRAGKESRVERYGGVRRLGCF